MMTEMILEFEPKAFKVQGSTFNTCPASTGLKGVQRYHLKGFNEKTTEKSRIDLRLTLRLHISFAKAMVI